ncbi:hypothetical protein BHE74_00044115, partial [Ensete ventricosum]
CFPCHYRHRCHRRRSFTAATYHCHLPSSSTTTTHLATVVAPHTTTFFIVAISPLLVTTISSDSLYIAAFVLPNSIRDPLPLAVANRTQPLPPRSSFAAFSHHLLPIPNPLLSLPFCNTNRPCCHNRLCHLPPLAAQPPSLHCAATFFSSLPLPPATSIPLLPTRHLPPTSPTGVVALLQHRSLLLSQSSLLSSSPHCPVAIFFPTLLPASPPATTAGHLYSFPPLHWPSVIPTYGSTTAISVPTCRSHPVL